MMYDSSIHREEKKQKKQKKLPKKNKLVRQRYERMKMTYSPQKTDGSQPNGGEGVP